MAHIFHQQDIFPFFNILVSDISPWWHSRSILINLFKNEEKVQTLAVISIPITASELISERFSFLLNFEFRIFEKFSSIFISNPT